MKVLRFAEEIDQSARRFYEEMAARTEDAGIRRIFATLADEETAILNHHRALARRGDSLDAETLNQGVNVFEQLRHREDQLQVTDDVAAYHLALDAEREVLRQYLNAARDETQPEVRKLLARLARDEQHQVAELENLYDFANAPNHYLAWGEFSNISDFKNFGRDLV
jgi:rubrerythrin